MIHYFAVGVLISVIHIFCLLSITEPRFSTKKTVILYIVAGCLFTLLTAGLQILLSFNRVLALGVSFLVALVEMFLFFLVISKDWMSKKLFLFSNYANVFCIYCCISIMVCHSIFPKLSEVVLMYIKIAFFLLLAGVTIPLYLKFVKPVVKKLKSTDKYEWYSITLVSIFFLLGFSILTVACRAYYKHTAYIPVFIVAVLIYGSGLLVIFRVFANMNNKIRIKLISQNLEYLQNQLDEYNKNEIFEKTIRHDYRHHNANIAQMIREGKTLEALKYIENYDATVESAFSKQYCAHITVNAILNNFSKRAEKENIKFSAFSDVPKDVVIADTDFVAIISNLLENAINGCRENSGEKVVKITIRSIDDKVVIVCSNSIDKAIEIEDNMIKNKGIGIESIMWAISNYDGDINYEVCDGMITVCVILNQ